MTAPASVLLVLAGALGGPAPAGGMTAAARVRATSYVRAESVAQAAPSGQATPDTQAASGARPAPARQALPDSVIDERTREIASGLRCVVCQGLSIADSPAELAREMRAIVREQVAAGRSREEVREFFVDRYGEFVLLEPRPRGFNLVVYVLPAAALVLGALAVVAFVRRWSGEEPTGTP